MASLEIPWLDGEPVDLTPCRSGWREVTIDGHVECDAYPEGGPRDCAEGEAHFPGEPDCRPVGDACPTGRFADTLPSGAATIFVDPTAAAGGDGSMGAPFSSLSSVRWTSLSSGDVVALSKGSHEGTIPLRGGVTVIGACARDTILTGVDAPVPAVVLAASTGEPGTLRNVTIDAPRQAGVSTDGAHAIAVEGVVVHGTTPFGVVSYSGGEMTLSDVAISDTVAGDAGGGYPISVTDGHLSAERVVVQRGMEAGMVLAIDAAAELEDVAILDTEPNAARLVGRGMILQQGAQVSASGLYMSGNRELSIDAHDAATTLTLEDVVIADTQPAERGGTGGGGILLKGGVQLTATRMLVANGTDDAIYAEGGAVTLGQVVLRDMEPTASTGLLGRGIELQGGVALTATQVMIDRVHEIGLYALGSSTADLTDFLIRDVAARPSDDTKGVGLVVRDGASLTAARLVVERAVEVGILVDFEGTSAALSDCLVRDIQARPTDNTKGRGVQVQRGASLDAERLRIERVFELGVVAADGASVTVSDVAVSNVAYPPCIDTDCPDSRYAHGLLVVSSGLNVNRFEVDDVQLCGVLLSYANASTTPPEVDLSTGVIQNAEIGACVNLDSYDLERLSNRVVFRDNTTNLETTSLPVPGIIEGAL